MNAGPNDFKGNRLTCLQPRQVHLCNRGGGDRLSVACVRDLRKGMLEFSFDDRFDLSKRDWWDPILKFAELPDVFRRKHVRPGAH